jgi:hypothetical protein
MVPVSVIIRQAHIAHSVMVILTATANMVVAVVVVVAAAAVVAARLLVDALIGPLTVATENVSGTSESQ